MIDLDYKNKSYDYILDFFYGYEDDFYIGIKYKDGTIIKVPFTIHNYNAICLKMEKQYYRFIKEFTNYKIIKSVVELIKLFYDLVVFIICNGLVFCGINDIIYFCYFFMISGSIFLLTEWKKMRKFLSLEKTEINSIFNIDNYLKNKEYSLIELPNGKFTYALNIANINSEKTSSYEKEIKGQVKILEYIAKKENNRDDLND